MTRKSSGFKNVAGLLFEGIIMLFIVTYSSHSDGENNQAERTATFVAAEQVILHDGDLRIEGKEMPQHIIYNGDNGISSFVIRLNLPLAICKGLLTNMCRYNAFYVFLTTSAP